MDCKKSGELMMKYMDKNMTKQEAFALQQHIGCCKLCEEDFMIYDQMMSELSEPLLIDAPEHFEALVMERILVLEPLSQRVTNTIDNIWCAAWGAFSILLGVGTVLVLNRDAILAYFAAYPQLAGYMAVAHNLSVQVTGFTNETMLSFSMISSSASSYLALTRYFLIAILTVLVGAQFYIYRKDKVEV